MVGACGRGRRQFDRDRDRSLSKGVLQGSVLQWFSSSKTEFLGSVHQCGTVVLENSGGIGNGVVFGGETVAGTAVQVVAATANVMNQLGTVYATKRRRRNGKRLVTISANANAIQY